MNNTMTAKISTISGKNVGENWKSNWKPMEYIPQEDRTMADWLLYFEGYTKEEIEKYLAEIKNFEYGHVISNAECKGFPSSSTGPWQAVR